MVDSNTGSTRGDLPVLLIAGDADPVNEQLKGLHFLEQLWRDNGVQSIDTQYYAGGRHEMFNETNRDQVTQDLIAWIDKVLA